MINQILGNRWVSLGLRLLVGAVFVYAGAVKLAAPQAFADSIATFRLLPAQLVDLLALGLPLFEVVLGALLVLGRWTRTSALGALFSCGMFALALASALLRGLPVDCGCFGGHGASSVFQGWISLGRDVVLGAVALALYVGQGRSGRSTMVPDPVKGGLRRKKFA